MKKEHLLVIFKKAQQQYPELNKTKIHLKVHKSFFFTMSARIDIYSFLFCKKREYSVVINSNQKSILSQLNDDDYYAWFGHELAHIVDYETMSNSKLVFFFLQYIFYIPYRFKKERKINTFAYNNGFHKELYAIWKKFLAMDTGNVKYKKYIINNYKPKWGDIKDRAEKEGLNREIYLQN